MEYGGGSPPPSEGGGGGGGGGDSDADQPSAKRQRQVEERHLVDPQALRQAIIQSLNEPLVFRGYLSPHGSADAGGEGGCRGWPCLQWAMDDWMDVLGDRELTFRISPRINTEVVLPAPQWESECQKGLMTFVDFLDWAKGLTSCTTTCGMEVNCDTHWAYFDYYYLRCLPGECRLRGAVDWSAFGFPERGAGESTLWIGSVGANTPCHIDTYGCNLVAQVSGHKRWVLFPESQSGMLSATRVPYEESSIYSSVGFPRPSLRSHPGLAHTTPYVVTLDPGDVLFVPRHWWHSVENLDLAVSINTWVEVPGDDDERVKEALVMFQMASLCQGVTSVDLLRHLFNPNMLEVPTMASTSLLNLLLSEVLSARHSREGKGAKSQSDPHQDNHSSSQCQWRDTDWLAQHGIKKVPRMTFAEYQREILGGEGGGEGEEECHQHNEVPECAESEYSSDLRLLIDTFTDARVIDTLKMVLDEKIESQASGKQKGGSPPPPT